MVRGAKCSNRSCGCIAVMDDCVSLARLACADDVFDVVVRIVVENDSSVSTNLQGQRKSFFFIH